MRLISMIVCCTTVFLLFTCSNKSSSSSKELPEKTDHLAHLPDDKAGEVIRQAIAFAGGWEAHQNKKTFSFYKNIESLDSTGNVIRRQRQLHQYQLQPVFKAHLSWTDNGNEFVIIYDGFEAKKYKNGKELTDQPSRNEAWNTSFGSHYVITMPFKLADRGATLTYEGIDTMAERRVHAIKVTYEQGVGSAGGIHQWWYYFDESNYDLVASFLDHGQGYLLTEYEHFETVNNIRVHNKRLAFIAGPDKKSRYLKTIYRNEEMQFNGELAAGLFDMK